MSWNIIIVLVFLGINLVFGLFRGWKAALIRLATITLSLGVSVGLAVGLQAWCGGFEFLHLFNPDAVTGIVAVLNGIIPFADKVVPVLGTIFFSNNCSVIIAIIIFLVLNKLFLLLYHVLAGIGRATEKAEVVAGKKKLRITHGVTSTIFGTLIGLIQGLLISCIFYAPICEIVAYFV